VHVVDRPYGVGPGIDQEGNALALENALLRPTQLIEPHLAVNAVHALVVPRSTQMPQAVVALPESPTQLDGHDLVERLDDRAIALGAINTGSVERRPRQPGC
jgi:hypothetical protein